MPERIEKKEKFYNLGLYLTISILILAILSAMLSLRYFIEINKSAIRAMRVGSVSKLNILLAYILVIIMFSIITIAVSEILVSIVLLKIPSLALYTTASTRVLSDLSSMFIYSISLVFASIPILGQSISEKL